MGTEKTVHANPDRGRLSTLSEPVLRRRSPSHTKQNKRTHPGRFLVALLAIASITCNFITGLLPSAPKSGELTGPIIGMIPGASLDKNGALVDPKFTFDPTEPQITVVVQVGKVSGSPLTITWYQETEGGDQKLFAHDVEVAAYDRAYSIGKNPGTLASGTYKVIAALEGQTEEMEFDVSPQKASSRPDAAPVSFHQDATPPTPARQGAPPVSGGSGTIPQSESVSLYPSHTTSTSLCSDLLPKGLYNAYGADVVDVFYRGQCPHAPQGTLYGVYVSATVNGPAKVIGTYVADPNASLGDYYIDPCTLSGGSDLPGTKMLVTSSAQDSAGKEVDSSQATYTLADDTLAPRVLLSPPNGTRVNPGQKINITVTAQEKRKNGPWQSGVKVIHVSETQVNGRNEFFTWNNPSALPKACNAKTWDHTEHTTYTVPQKPPPFIEICASADDWFNSGAETCYQYPTGYTWKGKFHLVSSDYTPAGACLNETWDGTFQVVVAPVTGEVRGDGSANLIAPPAGGSPGCGKEQATQARFDVFGTYSGGSAYSPGFEFRLMFSTVVIGGGNGGLSNYTFFLYPLDFSQGDVRTPPDFTVPVIAPGDAEAQLSNSVVMTTRETGKAQITISLLCQDCK